MRRGLFLKWKVTYEILKDGRWIKESKKIKAKWEWDFLLYRSDIHITSISGV